MMSLTTKTQNRKEMNENKIAIFIDKFRVKRVLQSLKEMSELFHYSPKIILNYNSQN